MSTLILLGPWLITNIVNLLYLSRYLACPFFELFYKGLNQSSLSFADHLFNSLAFKIKFIMSLINFFSTKSIKCAFKSFRPSSTAI
jgi:hypothetical protein